MLLWKTIYDASISILPPSSPAFLPVIFHPAGFTKSVHVAIYLPTQGLEYQFLEELTNLSRTVDELRSSYPEAPMYLRGDFNIGNNNTRRSELLNQFCSQHSLLQAHIPKPTYHHFLGNGRSDSFLDRILFSDNAHKHETVSHIECKLENPLNDSHHDLIISSWHFLNESTEISTDENIEAPLVDNKRVKVLWTDHGIDMY